MVQHELNPICEADALINKENKLSINNNGDLQSWSDGDDIIFNAIFPENFRCIIFDPSECGKTFLIKEIIICYIYFTKLYIRCLTSDQYEGVEQYNYKAGVEFIKDVKDLPSPTELNLPSTKRVKETYDI